MIYRIKCRLFFKVKGTTWIVFIWGHNKPLCNSQACSCLAIQKKVALIRNSDQYLDNRLPLKLGRWLGPVLILIVNFLHI